jgi:hypothetical protein
VDKMVKILPQIAHMNNNPWPVYMYFKKIAISCLIKDSLSGN